MNLEKDNFVGTDIEEYIKEIKNIKILSKEEQRKLLEEYNKGDKKSFLKLYYSNLRLVIRIAKMFYIPNHFLSLMDLIQEGNLGLIKAIERYNLNYKTKFTTYAYYWIKLYIERALYNNSYSIRIPINKQEEYSLYQKKFNYLNNILDREPVILELSKELKWSKEKIIDLINLENMMEISSLNYLVGNNEEDELLDVFKYDLENVEENVINLLLDEEKKKYFYEFINNIGLTKIQLKVLELRFGLVDNIPRGYSEVANILGYPDRRYVFEIEKRALNKIKKAKGLLGIAKIYEIEEEKIKFFK